MLRYWLWSTWLQSCCNIGCGLHGYSLVSFTITLILKDVAILVVVYMATVLLQYWLCSTWLQSCCNIGCGLHGYSLVSFTITLILKDVAILVVFYMATVLLQYWLWSTWLQSCFLYHYTDFKRRCNIGCGLHGYSLVSFTITLILKDVAILVVVYMAIVLFPLPLH